MAYPFDDIYLREFARTSDFFSGEPSFMEVKGVNVGGQINGWMGRAKELTFADFQLQYPVVYIAEESGDRNGQLGYGVLKRFTITFDYSRRRVFFQPNSTLGQLMQFDHAGLTLAAKGPAFVTLTVFFVIAGTPAAAADLKEGDEIISINNRHYTLESARVFLEEALGPQVFRIRRKGKELTVTVNCRVIV